MSTNKVYLFLLTFFFVHLSCKPQRKAFEIIEFELHGRINDTCVVLKNTLGDTISFYRDIEIVENTYPDTLRIGYSILPPKQSGALYYARYDTNKEEIIYSDPAYIDYIMKTDSPAAKSKFLCVYTLGKQNLNHIEQPGFIKFQLKVPK